MTILLGFCGLTWALDRYGGTQTGQSVTLTGEIELEVHDIQGRGGPGFDSVSDTRTLGTRSPTAELDSLVLSPRWTLTPELSLITELAFTEAEAWVQAAWFDWTLGTHHAELGLHWPISVIDFRSEREPLLARALWLQSEMLFATDKTWGWFRLSGSIGWERPLGFAPIQDSSSATTTLRILASEQARPFSGNPLAASALAEARTNGWFLQSFVHASTLTNESGTDVLASTFVNLDVLPHQDRTRSIWAGSRGGWDHGPLHVWAEGIWISQGPVNRWGAYLQGSLELPINMGPITTIEPLFRGETLRFVDGASVRNGTGFRSAAVGHASTWDWDVWTAAIRAELVPDRLNLRGEYSWIAEHNGVPALGIPNQPINNNELVLQLEATL